MKSYSEMASGSGKMRKRKVRKGGAIKVVGRKKRNGKEFKGLVLFENRLWVK